MRCLWRQPVRMDNARLRAVLGHEPRTPLDAAVEAALMGMDCLSAERSMRQRAIEPADAH